MRLSTKNRHTRTEAGPESQRDGSHPNQARLRRNPETQLRDDSAGRPATGIRRASGHPIAKKMEEEMETIKEKSQKETQKNEEENCR